MSIYFNLVEHTILETMKDGFTSDVLKLNIRYLRKKMNLSQEELANAIGLNRGNIASYESGTAEPKIANLVKMSKLFSVPLADLTETKICEKYVSMSIEDWRKESDKMARELKIQREMLEKKQKYFDSILNCRDMFKENNPILSEDAQELDMYFKQLQTLTEKYLKAHKEFIDRVSLPLECKDYLPEEKD